MGIDNITLSAANTYTDEVAMGNAVVVAGVSQAQLNQAITNEANARQGQVNQLNTKLQNTNQTLQQTDQALSGLNDNVVAIASDLQTVDHAMFDPDGKVNIHINNTEIHVTQNDKNRWDLATGGGGLQSIVAGAGIEIDYTDPLNPVISATSTPPPAGFHISSFTHNAGNREKGVPLTAITFNWAYQNGSPTTQSIAPTVGNIPTADRTTSLSGQNITDDITFTLSATDGITPVTRQVSVRFYSPVFYGSVLTATPSATDIQAMEKRVSPFTNFTANLSIANARSCFASPMENPITDIRDTVFNMSMLSNYTAIDNVMINGTAYKVWVSNALEDTGAGTIGLQVVF